MMEYSNTNTNFLLQMLYYVCLQVKIFLTSEIKLMNNRDGLAPVPLYQANICLFKGNNRKTRKRCDICLRVTIKTLKQSQ